MASRAFVGFRDSDRYRWCSLSLIIVQATSQKAEVPETNVRRKKMDILNRVIEKNVNNSGAVSKSLKAKVITNRFLVR